MSYTRESTIVRMNLMENKDYSPYCGNCFCPYMAPRTKQNKETFQFHCKCGFVTEFPQDFIDRYKAKHNLNS